MRKATQTVFGLTGVPSVFYGSCVGEVLSIRNFSTAVVEGWNEVSAEVDGERIFYRSPAEYDLAPRVEAFVSVALLEAMIRGIDIRVEDGVPMSAQVHAALPEMQAVFACWNWKLQPIEVDARLDTGPDDTSRVTSFFSAGVDSSHTLCRRMNDITHLILLNGFDTRGFGDHGLDPWRKAIEKQSVFASSIGKELLPIETNAKTWAVDRAQDWSFGHGLMLSSMGPMLKAKRLYVPSSHTYNELFPWGTHPLTDPMWTSESTQVIHDGAGSRRGEKMKELADHQAVLDNLQVCWRSICDNCGECNKCIRTMAALYLLGQSSKALPPLNGTQLLSDFGAEDENGASFLEDAMILAKEAGDNAVYRALKRKYRAYQVGQIVPVVDRHFLGGTLRKVYRRVKKPNWLNFRVTLRGPRRWEE